MKKITFLSFFILTIIFSISFFILRNKNVVQPRLSGAGKAMNMVHKMRTYPEGRLDMKKYTQAYEIKKLQSQLKDEEFTANWEDIGPKNIGGRTLCLAFHPTNPNVIFAGSASGGLWKTETGGEGVEAWSFIETNHPVLGVGSIVINPQNPDEMFIGTGEVYNYQNTAPGIYDRITRGSYGIGVLKSNDGGTTWEKSLDWSYGDMRGVMAMAINPENPNTVFAGTSEGLYISHNSGDTWELVLEELMVNDIEINPQDTTNVFVSVGNLSTEGGGIYRSLNGGNSDFVKLQGGLPSSFGGKALLTLSPNNPTTILASVANSFNSLGLYKTENNGDNWTNINTEDVAKYQGWFAHDVAINPSNEDEIVYVGVDAWKSYDGGFTLEQKGFWYNWGFGVVPIGGPEGPDNYVHADIHAAYFHPTQENVVYLATDGGIFKSEDAGDTWQGRNGGYQTTQFYANFSSSMTDSLHAIGGLQDNSTAVYLGDGAWRRVLGGDGACTAINPKDDNIVYGSSQFLYLSRSDDKGETFYSVSPPSDNSEVTAFIAPFEIAPNNSDILLAGTNFLWKSNDGGFGWEKTTDSPIKGTSPIITMAVAPSNDDVIYTAMFPVFDYPASIMKTDDGGTSFTDITSNLPDRVVLDIAIDYENPEFAYVVLGGFGTSHVFKTDDGGEIWVDISDGLPDVPTNSIVIDPLEPNYLYVSNDVGVYFSEDGGNSWVVYDEGLPTAVLGMHLSISPSNRKIRIATHGSGVFESDMVKVEDTPPITSTENLIRSNFDLKQNYPNPVKNNTTFAFTLSKKSQVNLSIFNQNGQLIKTVFDEQMSGGVYQETVNLTNLPPQIYYYTLTTNDGKMSKVLVKE